MWPMVNPKPYRYPGDSISVLDFFETYLTSESPTSDVIFTASSSTVKGGRSLMHDYLSVDHLEGYLRTRLRVGLSSLDGKT